MTKNSKFVPAPVQLSTTNADSAFVVATKDSPRN